MFSIADTVWCHRDQVKSWLTACLQQVTILQTGTWSNWYNNLKQIDPKWLSSIGVPDTKHAALNTGALELVRARWLCSRDALEGSGALSGSVMLIYLAAGQQEFQSILYLPWTSQACLRLPCGSEFHTLDDWLWLRSKFCSQNICYKSSYGLLPASQTSHINTKWTMCCVDQSGYLSLRDVLLTV